MAEDFQVLSSADDTGAPVGNKDTGNYTKRLTQRSWRYHGERFAGREELFDRNRPTLLRPPVFRKIHAEHNIIVSKNAPADLNARVIDALPESRRHRWFASMKSSQALAQSVFANLVFHEKLSLLVDLPSEDGETAFLEQQPPAAGVRLETEIRHLGEPTPTSVDVLIENGARVAIECKLTEWEAGSCSRPMMEDEDPRYCDGNYRRQNSRLERCQLSSIGVRYWDYIPALFDWSSNQDHAPCPLRFTFQLVRNVLAACVAPGGSLNTDGHALLIYDARNPSFAPGGAAFQAWRQVRSGLKNPAHIRRMSWQRLLERLQTDPELGWLTGELEKKYGFSAPGSSRPAATIR